MPLDWLVVVVVERVVASVGVAELVAGHFAGDSDVDVAVAVAAAAAELQLVAVHCVELVEHGHGLVLVPTGRVAGPGLVPSCVHSAEFAPGLVVGVGLG